MSQSPPAVPPPVAEIERHLRWRVLPTVLFVASLVTLGTLGVVAILVRPARPRGVPDDPEARRAAAVLAGRVAVATNALRFRSALLGGEVPNRSPSGGMLQLAAAARPALEGAWRRHRGDARALAALAALDLMEHDYRRAATRYRRACELAPHYGEGRLGAGVALALEADRTPDAWQARALRLQAIAQFAMVDSLQEEYAAALFDRATSLADVGRDREAAFWAARYRAFDDTSAWSRRLPR